MTPRFVPLLAVATFAILAAAQTMQPVAPVANPQTGTRLEFEVASLKPADPAESRSQTMSGGPGTQDPAQLRYAGVALAAMIREAYGAIPYDQISGPEWMWSERYTLVAKVPPGSTREQVRLMLQNLLADRMKLAVHHIMKEFPVYHLVIAKGGPKLTAAEPPAADAQPRRPGDPMPPLDRDGYPQLPPGRGHSGRVTNGIYHETFRSYTMAQLVVSPLGMELGTRSGVGTFAPGRVTDQTGLTGTYDFKLEYTTNGMVGSALAPPTDGASDPGGASIFTALEKQLGLRLEKSKAAYDVVVVDHVEKVPSAN